MSLLDNLTLLPDLLRLPEGRRATATDWPSLRAAWSSLVLPLQYGHLPPAPAHVMVQPLHRYDLFPEDGVNIQHFRITMDGKCSFLCELMLPPGAGPFPVVVDGDGCWRYLTNDILSAAARRGYGVAFFNRTEIVPDVYSDARDAGLYLDYPDGDFGALAAWAWGYHRVLDALETIPRVDAQRFVVTGHSRGGKAALLAGATDPRVAVTAPNNSGCGGAGSYYFPDVGGERLEDIVATLTYWFTPRLRDFYRRARELPFDQHCLKALVAPRALLTTEALDDHWASPRGTYLTFTAARAVYRLLDVDARLGIAYRPGGHAHTLEDWHTLFDFADAQWSGTPSTRDFTVNPWEDE